jgi:hypothetical protein
LFLSGRVQGKLIEIQISVYMIDKDGKKTFQRDLEFDRDEINDSGMIHDCAIVSILAGGSWESIS